MPFPFAAWVACSFLRFLRRSRAFRLLRTRSCCPIVRSVCQNPSCRVKAHPAPASGQMRMGSPYGPARRQASPPSTHTPSPPPPAFPAWMDKADSTKTPETSPKRDEKSDGRHIFRHTWGRIWGEAGPDAMGTLACPRRLFGEGFRRRGTAESVPWKPSAGSNGAVSARIGSGDREFACRARSIMVWCPGPRCAARRGR